MDRLKFQNACEKIQNAAREQNGIGTLGEKTLHAVLKQYFEPDVAHHEAKLGAFVADIVTARGVTEIQTRAMNKLRKKLAAFLELCPVTVVYPVPKTKWLLWIDTQTGETTKKRKSPKRGSIFDAVHELYKIKPLLGHPNFRFCIVLIDMEEYRYLSGWSRDKKKGSTRCDRIPVDLVEELYFNAPADYAAFLPDGLPDRFTSRDYLEAAKTNLRTAQIALNVLNRLGVVQRVGKQGNLHVYARVQHFSAV